MFERSVLSDIYHDGVFGECLPDIADKLYKVLWVAIGHVHTDVLEIRDGLDDGTQFLQVALTCPCACCYMLSKNTIPSHF